VYHLRFGISTSAAIRSARIWLKDCKGRLLNYDDLTHYQGIVVALKETIRLMAEIDALIPLWPLE
jgi:hypothetical protein